MSLTLREWRRLKEISQKTMSERLNIHINTYQKWEQNPGKIPFKDAVNISKVLDVPLDEIIFKVKNTGETA